MSLSFCRLQKMLRSLLMKKELLHELKLKMPKPLFREWKKPFRSKNEHRRLQGSRFVQECLNCPIDTWSIHFCLLRNLLKGMLCLDMHLVSKFIIFFYVRTQQWELCVFFCSCLFVFYFFYFKYIHLLLHYHLDMRVLNCDNFYLMFSYLIFCLKRTSSLYSLVHYSTNRSS